LSGHGGLDLGLNNVSLEEAKVSLERRAGMDGLQGVEEIWHAVRDDRTELNDTQIERHCWSSGTLSDCKGFGAGVQNTMAVMNRLLKRMKGGRLPYIG
jgi:hypothetical protein